MIQSNRISFKANHHCHRKRIRFNRMRYMEHRLYRPVLNQVRNDYMDRFRSKSIHSINNLLRISFEKFLFFILFHLISPNLIVSDSFGSIAEVTVECNSNLIKINLVSTHRFNGMIYPKGLSTNTSCMMEYFDVNEFEYRLPLRACNTMSTELVSEKSASFSISVG